LKFPNQVFESKSVNPIPRYHTFSGSTPAKPLYPENIEKLKNLITIKSQAVALVYLLKMFIRLRFSLNGSASNFNPIRL
jgi:hypothetical protein